MEFRMKANTPELMKFKRLQRRLNDTRRGIVGLLESLWIGVAKNCPEGDVGRFSNEEIAIMVDWEGDADQLIEALIECGWIDSSDQYRLVVHDWHEHCPTYVRGGLAKQKKEPIGTSYRYNLNKTEVQPIGSPKATASEVPSTIPSLTKPNLTKPRERQTEPENPLSFSSHGKDLNFQKAWRSWIAKQSAKSGRIDQWTQQGQLKELERFSTEEAIAVVEYSTSRTNCVNLITNGDHRKAMNNSKSTFAELGL
jgi:hypothetical protein